VRVRIPPPVSGGIILSYKCSAECLHCMYACTPLWNGGWMQEKDLELLISELAKTVEPAPGGPERISVNHGIHFTGGEPFTNFGLLCRAAELSRGCGVPSTFVETNCFWCSSDRVVREKLELLKEKGLKGVLVSVNPFYLEFVPFEYTERAVRIAQELFGKNVIVYQGEYFRRFLRMGIRGKMGLEEYAALEGPESLFGDAEFFLSGRAPYRLAGRLKGYLRGREPFPRFPAGRLYRERCLPVFLRNWHNHFDGEGNFIPGFCGGITLGDARKLPTLLEEGLDLSERPVLELLAADDFKGLMRFARDRGYEELKEGYVSKCHLCVDIRRHLVQAGEFVELKPVEFYRHLV